MAVVGDTALVKKVEQDIWCRLEAELKKADPTRTVRSVSLIDPDGHRVSWLGAPTRAVISATHVTSQREESLALRGGKPGEYLLEVSRGSGAGRVQGTEPSSG